MHCRRPRCTVTQEAERSRGILQVGAALRAFAHVNGRVVLPVAQQVPDVVLVDLHKADLQASEHVSLKALLPKYLPQLFSADLHKADLEASAHVRLIAQFPNDYLSS